MEPLPIVDHPLHEGVEARRQIQRPDTDLALLGTVVGGAAAAGDQTEGEGQAGQQGQQAATPESGTA